MSEKEFISFWTKKLSDGKTKPFPGEFIGECSLSEIKLPGTSLTLGDELFGSVEIVDTHGNSVIMAESLPKAKYILYGSNNKPSSLKIPDDEKVLAESVKKYEKYMDSILKEIETDYKSKFQETKNFPRVSLEIFNSLNLRRY